MFKNGHLSNGLSTYQLFTSVGPDCRRPNVKMNSLHNVLSMLPKDYDVVGQEARSHSRGSRSRVGHLGGIFALPQTSGLFWLSRGEGTSTVRQVIPCRLQTVHLGTRESACDCAARIQVGQWPKASLKIRPSPSSGGNGHVEAQSPASAHGVQDGGYWSIAQGARYVRPAWGAPSSPHAPPHNETWLFHQTISQRSIVMQACIVIHDDGHIRNTTSTSSSIWCVGYVHGSVSGHSSGIIVFGDKIFVDKH